MPWKETSVDELRQKLVAAWDEANRAELCRLAGVSRKTGYKWVKRAEEGGEAWFRDHSRAPKHCPHAVDDRVVEKIVQTRAKHPTWGPKKVAAWLVRHETDLVLPALSTIGDILRRHGLTAPKKQRRRVPPYGRPFAHANEPNAVWSADYKGQFRTGNGRLCYPLTISDNYSRFLLRCQALTSTSLQEARPVFEACFREYGLPSAIRTDNGSPFAGSGLTGLTELSVWWLKLGIAHERILQGHPEQNGRHERMHLTLDEVIVPPRPTWRGQQRAFDAFRQEYNHERPHEALDMNTPTSAYRPSWRPMPKRVPGPEYPEPLQVRKVSCCGQVNFEKRIFYLSAALAGEHVGLWEHEAGLWVVRYAHQDLAVLDLAQREGLCKLKALPPGLHRLPTEEVHQDPSVTRGEVSPRNPPPPVGEDSGEGVTHVEGGVTPVSGASKKRYR